MITKELINEGFLNGRIKITKSPFNDGIVCQIGEYWFYFGGESASEYTNPDEYVYDMSHDEIVNDIFETLEDFRLDRIAGEFVDEYNYYEAYLREGKAEMKDRNELKNKNEVKKTDISEGFEMIIDKVCPACATTCPNLYLDYEELHVGTETLRHYYCDNRDICVWCYDQFKKKLINHSV